jgi:hypothetical protein
MKTATIVAFSTNPGSGIAQLTLNRGGRITSVPCDNGQTVRTFDDLFPGFIVGGHSCDPKVIIGQTVGYDVDDIGLLAYLTTDLDH